MTPNQDTHQDQRFSALLTELGLDNECDTVILKMRIAFLLGTGQSIDARSFRHAMELANQSTPPATEHPCKCAETKAVGMS